MSKGGFGESNDPVNGLDAIRGKTVINPDYKDTRVWLTSGFWRCKASDNCIYHKAIACRRRGL